MSSIQQGIEKNFHIAYFITSKGRPYTDFSDLVELEKKHEVKFVPSAVMRMKQLAKIPFHFVPIQYLMQISGTKLIVQVLLVFYAMAPQTWRFLKKNAFTLFVDPDTFKAKVTFFALKDVPWPDVQSIYSAIKSSFKDPNLEHLLSKIEFVGSDSASLNTGTKDGQITIVCQETPCVGFVRCLTHRLELALKDALKERIDSISTCLQNLYYLYKKSNKKIRVLRELTELFTKYMSLKITKWNPIEHVVEDGSIVNYWL